MSVRDYMFIARLLMCLPFLLQPVMALDETQIQFYEALEVASAEGIPSLIGKLDTIAKNASSSSFAPYIHETIQMVGLLHPGSVPDRVARLESLKASAAGSPGLAKVLKRIDILQSYYISATQGHPESASAALSDPVLEGSPYGMQALADAALRARDYGKAAALAYQVIEDDPYSPLLSNAYMVLGLSSAFRGDSKSALIHFQRALAVSSLSTIYGNPRDYVFTAYRFSRPVPAAVGEVFDEVLSTRMADGTGLKDPQALISGNKGYILLDKETILTVSSDGKVLDRKPTRKIEDIAATRDGKIYTITDEQIDLGSGSVATLSLTVGKKTKRITKLRSLTIDARGDIYFLDQDLGILRSDATVKAGSLSIAEFAPVKGRLIRTDGWGNLYVLSPDQRSILILAKDGKQLGSLQADPVAGKLGLIEYFALDSLNHIYILEDNSIQIFAMISSGAGFEKKRVGLYALDPRPQFRNLRVLGVNATGELVTTGKNEDNWVYFK
jgi:hypothetical protein